MQKDDALRIARRARLSRNAERHIRKHFNEFGFKSPRDFSRRKILRLVNEVTRKYTRAFYEPDEDDAAIILLRSEILLIVDVQRQLIKTMFVVVDREYVTRKLRRGIWIELQL